MHVGFYRVHTMAYRAYTMAYRVYTMSYILYSIRCTSLHAAHYKVWNDRNRMHPQLCTACLCYVLYYDAQQSTLYIYFALHCTPYIYIALHPSITTYISILHYTAEHPIYLYCTISQYNTPYLCITLHCTPYIFILFFGTLAKI